MKKSIITTIITTMLSFPVMAESQTPLIIEADYNEDVSMWLGDDYNAKVTKYPYLIMVKPEKSCSDKKINGTKVFYIWTFDEGVEYYYTGKNNPCEYEVMTEYTLEHIKENYCMIAEDRGGDIDLQLAEEQGCFLND